MDFKNKLRYYRELRGYSSIGLAKLLNVPYSTYKGYENLGREPKYDILCKLADILNVSIDSLLGRVYTQDHIMQILDNALSIANKKHNTNIKITKTSNDDIYFKNYASTIPIEYSVSKNTFVQAFNRIDENTSDIIAVYLSNKSTDTIINKLQENLIKASSLTDENERTNKIKTISTAINNMNAFKIDNTIYKDFFKDE